MRRLVEVPWQSVETPESGQTYLALLSYLPLKGYRHMFDLIRQSRAVSDQLEHSPGLIGFSFRAKFLRHRFWTLSAWDDERALQAFVGASPHLDAMKALSPHMGESGFVRWSVDGKDLPLRWEDALRRMPSRPG